MKDNGFNVFMNKQFYFLVVFFTLFNLRAQENLIEFNRDELIESGRSAFFNKKFT